MPPCIAHSLLKLHVSIGSSAYRMTRKTVVHGSRLYGSGRHLKGFKESHTDTLTALHRTSLTLSHVPSPEKLPAWEKLLRTSGNILSGVTVRRPRIAVLGLDELAHPHQLVSALLDDPLASDQSDVRALRSLRRESPNELLIIGPGDLQRSGERLSLGLPWLKKMDVDILEIPSEHPDRIPLLYADVQVLIISPLATPLSVHFRSLLLMPELFVVLQYPTFDQQVVDYVISQLTRRHPESSNILKSKILQVYPAKALSALDLFRQESKSVDAIQAFQKDFASSGVTAFSQSISKVLSLDQETRNARYARGVLTGALEACQEAAQNASHDAVLVQNFVNDLHSWISNAQITSVQDILGGDDAPKVGDFVQRSTREMQLVIDAIPWWRLPFKVDDLSEALLHAAERVWYRDLRSKLEFQTGRLASLRSTLTSNTFAGLSGMPSSFHSALLINQLHQLSARPPELAPDTLTYPLLYRLRQLEQPILSLHRRAQRAMFALSVTTFGSVGASYTAWLADWMAPSTAVGLGALGFILGLRWLVGMWEKGKTRWWEDWQRVGHGLNRDIKQRLALIIHEKVTDAPSKAAEELEKLLALRLAKITQLNRELNSIKSGLRRPE